MKVRDVMQTDIASVREDASLASALELMRWRGGRQIPVLRGAEVVGVLTDRDVARIMGHGAPDALGGSVGDVMSRAVSTVGPETDVAEAASTLAIDPIGCLAVIERDRLIGLVTPTDLLRVLARPTFDTAGAAWRP